MSQDDLKNASKTSVHDTVKALNAQVDDAPKNSTSPLSEGELARLGEMTREQLIGLIRRNWPPSAILTLEMVRRLKKRINDGKAIDTTHIL